MRRPKKPVAVALWQAYSKIYFKKGSGLSVQVHTDFEAFKAGDEAALAKYSHLFSESDLESPSSILWLPFHQAVMTDLVRNASVEELEVVNKYTQTLLEKKLAAYNKPWAVYPGGDGDLEVVKKRNYLSR